MLIILLLLLLQCSLVSLATQKACFGKLYGKMDYYQPGDYIVGGNLPLGTYDDVRTKDFRAFPISDHTAIQMSILKNYQHFRAFAFAITELNKDPTLLLNTTLGFRIYEHMDIPRVMYLNSLSLLSTRVLGVLNYKCDRQDELISVIGGLDSQSSGKIASVMGIYKIPQLGYGLVGHVEGEKGAFPSFFRVDPNEIPQYEGLVQLLLHFHWNWIGLLVHRDDKGENFIQTLTPMLQKKDICVAFTDLFKTTDLLHLHRMETGSVPSSWFEPEVMVVLGDTSVIAQLMLLLSRHQQHTKTPFRKVWIMTSHSEITGGNRRESQMLKIIHGALQLQVQRRDVPKFKEFLLALDPSRPQGDIFLSQWWEMAFQCQFLIPGRTLPNGMGTCSGQENLAMLPRFVLDTRMASHGYNIYNSAYSVAHALHALSASRRRMRRERNWFLNIQPWQMLASLDNLRFNNSAGDEISFHENARRYDIVNWIFFPNRTFSSVKVGGVDPRAPPGQDFTIHSDAIVWATGKTPFARCEERCTPGKQRKVPEGKPVCCYTCHLCPEGTTSNRTDASRCDPCAEDQQPNRRQDQCIPKKIHFLSYQETLSVISISLALFLSLVTSLVLAAFIKHRHTPIVRANNRHLTYVLLVSLLLCFLCTFLFIGRPTKITCLLRQAAFSIVFSVAVSTILAKTVMVVLAFKATKPGNTMQRMLRTVCNSSSPLDLPEDYYSPGDLLVRLDQMDIFTPNFSVTLLGLTHLLKSITIMYCKPRSLRFQTCTICHCILSALASRSVSPSLPTLCIKMYFLGHKRTQSTLYREPPDDSTMLVCPLIQAAICGVWLLITPPFINSDFCSLAGEIIVECSEGSVAMFYSALACTAFLALISFTVAFPARKLPNSFNEAKFITFSMLVFCSMWVSFVPTYVSTKGKASSEIVFGPYQNPGTQQKGGKALKC
ncbi:hypothetical protein EYD10_17947 [Varanus komodoensis]|nr:hypothetical protein EYD10_17947 [Varanus komodoensis]